MSLMIVEVKDLDVLLKFLDASIMKLSLALLTIQMPMMVTLLRFLLISRGLQYQHLICFYSETCNTMKGQWNGVVRHLRDQQPDVLDLGCICCLEKLALKAAI